MTPPKAKSLLLAFTARRRGYRLGIVGNYGDKVPEGVIQRLKAFIRRWEKDWRTLLALRAHEIANETSEFSRIITADTLYTGSTQSPLWSDQDARYRRTAGGNSTAFEAWKGDVSRITQHRKTSIGPGGIMKSYVEPDEFTALKNSFRYAVNTASVSRRIFTTDNGFVGMGPASVDSRDKVYIVPGSRVPLILHRDRRAKLCSENTVRDLICDGSHKCEYGFHDTHALVGDAYVHGVMDGEFIDSSKRPEKLYLN